MKQPPASYAALYAPANSTPELLRIYSAQATVQAMLDVEAALARAEARCKLVPARAAAAIARACDAERFDLAAMARQGRDAGNLAIPLVAALTRKVARADAKAARYVHWGATSQDIVDTATVLQLRAGLAAIEADLTRTLAALARLARRHRRTIMTGRTLLQPAGPVTFGLKAALWRDALLRHHRRLKEAQARCLALQFGGAVGTLAALGPAGPRVARELGRLLRLRVPALPWHANRDRIGEVAVVLGLLGGSLAKMARDMALLMQGEIGELREPAAPGRGGSSAMPQKRNPVLCVDVLAATARIPGLVATLLQAQAQELERGAGNWQAEWPVLPELVLLSGGALRQMHEILAGLEVDAGRMRANFEAQRGLPMAEAVAMALAGRLGKAQAHALVARAARRAAEEGIHLRQAIGDEEDIASRLDGEALDRLFDPAAALGAAERMVAAALKLKP
ncbi:MAG: 3-carboxy-cis,cis-muconate cycloisomerase [Reyranellaceae bacterium]